jgi:outer membrane protein
MKKVLFSAPVVVALFLFSSMCSAGEAGFGYVAIQRAVTESIAGKEAMKRFEEDIREIEQDILKEKEDIEKLGEMLQKQSMMLTDSVRREKEKDFLKRQRDYERMVKDSKTDVQIKEAELTNEILEDLVPLVQKYGKENGYAIIFEKNDRILLYASDAIDLTGKVITLYDEQYKKKN